MYKRQAQVPWEEDSDIDEELKNLIKAEKEALCAVKLIRDNLGQPIFDSKKGEKRPLEKRDIVILMRGIRNYGDIFYKILADNDIKMCIRDSIKAVHVAMQYYSVFGSSHTKASPN